MAWSSIRIHRAAIAMIIDPLTNSLRSQHPMVCHFMKAVSLARPPPRKVKHIWSVSTVLEMRRSWGSLEELFRQKPTWRMAMLLEVAEHLVFGAKQDMPGHIPQDVLISKQSCRELCPLENIREYLRRTEGREGATCSCFALLFNL